MRIDENAGGAITVKPLSGSDPSPANVDGTLFFASDGQIWQTDGTEQGTVVFADRPEIAGGFAIARNFAALGDNFMFSLDEEVHGQELWVAPLRPVTDTVPPTAAITQPPDPHKMRLTPSTSFSASPYGTSTWLTSCSREAVRQICLVLRQP